MPFMYGISFFSETLVLKFKNPYKQGRTGHRENRENSRWPGSQFGPLPYIFFFMLLLLPAECTKVIISEFAIQ